MEKAAGEVEQRGTSAVVVDCREVSLSSCHLSGVSLSTVAAHVLGDTVSRIGHIEFLYRDPLKAEAAHDPLVGAHTTKVGRQAAQRHGAAHRRRSSAIIVQISSWSPTSNKMLCQNSVSRAAKMTAAAMIRNTTNSTIMP